MKTCHVEADKIWKVWHWCSDSYLRHGIKLAFPKHTDPVKTYQWRYCRSLAEKFEEWDFDDEMSVRFIDTAVKHAKKIGVLRKGLAVLHQGNMLDVVLDLLKHESASYIQSIESLVFVKKWLDTQIGDKDPVEAMLDRERPGAFCNIVIWHQASRLPAIYISLSKSCCKALAKLKKQELEERGLLPKMTDLYRLRSDFIQDINNLKQARNILGDDWRKLCH
jgi:hypothetical protein